MKKVSAFAVFKGKKEKENVSAVDVKDPKRGSMKKASSTPTINSEEESTSKKLLRAFKGGSFRNTIRGNKHKPSSLTNGIGNSPFVANDGEEVRLTGVKEKEKKGELNASVITTPAIPKKSIPKELKSDTSKELAPSNTKPEETPKLPPRDTKKKAASNTPGSSKSSNQKKEKTLSTVIPMDVSQTPSSSEPVINSSAISAEKKRKRNVGSPVTSSNKKKRVSSPKQQSSPKKPPVQSVNPRKKNKKKLMPNAILETVYDSREEASKLFDCMIHPVPSDKFFRELWQKKPLLVRRHISNYNDGWFSTEELDQILEQEQIEFGVNLDITSYRDGKRETHNPPGRAYRSVVWDFYQTGCSVRMLNPQTYSKNVWKMLSTLQEYFGCCVGANVYLTPPGTQGFAPHYDDIEAFILQLEGKKHWRLYNPRSEEETLPRESSQNFDESEIGSPILDVTLHAGDLLYFPRGTIHQGYALEDAHSLHITFSCYQKNTWGDLLLKLIPRALDIAIEEDVQFREGLPRDYLSYMGIANADLECPEREQFTQKVTQLVNKMVQNYCPIDAACDQMGKQFMHDSLPPVLSEVEKSCSVHGHGEHWDPVKSCVKGMTEMQPDAMIKLIRKGCLRLITEDDAVRVYHNLENSRVYHGKEPQFIEITAELAPAVEYLLHNYPDFVSIDSLPPSSIEEKIEIANLLYEKGLIITGEPLDSIHNEDESSSDNENDKE